MSTMTHSSSRRAATLYLRGAELHADLTVPADAVGLVILAQPRGSSRTNPGNERVANILSDASLATLFCDLLTEEEMVLSDLTGEFCEDVALMSTRLVAITDWCRSQSELRELPIGYLGVGVGAAVAFDSAAQRPTAVRALVVRGPLDLAWTSLSRARAPALLIAGEQDGALRGTYTSSLPHIASARKRIAIIPRADVLLSEPLMLDEYAEQASKWFSEHLGAAAGVRGWDETSDEIC